MVFEHFLNMLLFFVEFVINKNIFMLKHGVILYAYALLYRGCIVKLLRHLV